MRCTSSCVWDDDGRLTNPSLADYKVPGILDAPAMIVPIVLEDPDATGPFGAKGVGEISLVGVAPAIANADLRRDRRATAPDFR